ncbi:MAG: hypothetical protein JWO71_3145 [Candidatus Acidoferrum typicum]|nr:hypothetical protein [Candidatus Acidoferrum typicum]
MSPFPPSFRPQLDPFPRSPQALSPSSTAFTPNRSLSPLSTAFAQNTGGGVTAPSTLTGHESRVTNNALSTHPANDRFFTPLFSASSDLPFSQLLCFHNHLRCSLLFSATLNFQMFRPFQRAKTRLPITTFRMNTCKSVSKQRTLTPFRMNTCEKTGGRGCPPCVAI